ncbi:unnamed protein product [Didymodactylos carnosus]|uniref:Uncharacterized protein n=1 Tax=Didymodactylos carnosus TaxID=1234261 RepID=A0A814ELU8_9BILA|nr:unnamed protein product [Didymodactylos carnosus]CAF1429346.1 unnamed protein product [Didymodactylos carnosus]CAF3744247.1 unnamed protein product [Didymodactylos carnosus]CAF4227653.1 unnamed protein product [Didymodactylos carnosus]
MSSLNAHRSSTAKKVRSGTLSSTASDQTSLMSMSSPTTSANKVKSTSDSSNSSRLEHLVRRRRTIAGRPPYLQESTHFEEVTKASTITDRTSRKTMITTAIEETNQIGEDDWVGQHCSSKK